VGRDIGTDVAVIKVSAKELPSIRIADSDGVRVGDVVAAVGNPFGLEGSATLGIISAVMRAEIGYEEFEDFFQFDAMIHPGNSGGALVNGKGELIGINTVVAGPKGNPFGIGFAIPINMAKFVQNEIVAQGYVRRGSPGLVVGDLPPEMTTIEGGVIRRGALVKEVLPGSPAAAVGIKPGDVVFSIANKPVRGAAEYMTRIVSQPAGSSVPIGLWIDGKDARVIEVMLSSQAFKSTRTRLRRLMGTVAGLDVVDILPNSDLYDEYRGVEVKGVPPRSPAYAAGFEVGDIIVGIEGGKVRNTEDLITRIDAVGLQYRVDIVRNGRPFWIRASR
jgi:S1-C subfamily serine protease